MDPDMRTEKPTYRYWVHPKKEGESDVQAILVFDPEGRRMGMTQKWNGVTALEMVKDYVEISTDLVWPDFQLAAILNAYVMPASLAEELAKLLAYMEEDEHADYDRMVKEDGEDSQTDHAWLKIQRLLTWLEGGGGDQGDEDALTRLEVYLGEHPLMYSTAEANQILRAAKGGTT